MLVTAAIFSAILGQPVDGPQNGQAPPPWSIPCQAQALFNTETRFIEIPHTASVKVICFGICIDLHTLAIVFYCMLQ